VKQNHFNLASDYVALHVVQHLKWGSSKPISSNVCNFRCT